MNESVKPINKQILPLRLSSSIILYEKSQIPKKLLMFKRKAHISFGNAVVFPGGVCDKQDRQFSKKIIGSDNFQVYSKITAIRQLYEQTGILLIPNQNISIIKQIRQKYKKQKHFDYEFFCSLWKQHLEMILPLIRLLTVQLIPGKRFDTIFYTVDSNVVKININHIQQDDKITNLQNLRMSSEGQTYFWQQPKVILQKFVNKQIHLIPPQILILNCLNKIKSFSQFNLSRKQQVTQPILLYSKDLKKLILFGDSDYQYAEIIEKEPQSQAKQLLSRWINRKLNEIQFKDLKTQQKRRRFTINYKTAQVKFVSDYVERQLLGFIVSKQAKL